MLWVKKDAPQLVRDQLRKATGGKVEIRESLPDGWQARTSPPIVTVTTNGDEGGAGFDVELVRVAVHATDLPTARRVFTAIDSLMLTPLAIGWFFGVRPATRLVAHKNSKAGGGAVASAAYKITTSRGTV